MQPLDAHSVRDWRHRRMLSQQEVADRAGTSLFTIQRIERGEGNVRPKTGRAVAAALGVPIEELLPKVQAPLFPESPESAVGEERREDIYGPWLEFVDRYANRWEMRIEAGDFNLDNLEEFVRVLDELFPTLRDLEASERRELAAKGYQETYLHSKAGAAIGRLMSLFNPMLAAAGEKFPQEMLGDELEPLRRKREEMRRALERSA